MLLLILGLIASINSFAHNTGDHYLNIRYETNGSFKADWDFPYDYVLPLVKSKPETPDEQLKILQANRHQFAPLASQVSFSTESGPCTIHKIEVSELMNSSAYGEISYEGKCPDSATLEISFLNQEDKPDPMLISFYSKNNEQSIATTSNSDPARIAVVKDSLANLVTYIKGGIWHIWGGIDHILFLLSLLLPSVYFLQAKQWVLNNNKKQIFVDILKNISAFTLAHSITLCLVTFGLINVNAHFIEVVIALSVLLTAVNNIFPVVGHGRWKLAFIFGLVHGIGFAEVLVGLKMSTNVLVESLAGYNIGVELGQVAIVLVFVPIAYLLRASRLYRIALLNGGSGLIAIISLIWCCERIFDFHLLPF